MLQTTSEGPGARLVRDWKAARALLREIEEHEHPAITDQFGRVWTWRGGDLYAHDDTLAVPRDFIDKAGLPPESLRDNPNYARLCDICRSQWPPAPEVNACP